MIKEMVSIRHSIEHFVCVKIIKSILLLMSKKKKFNCWFLWRWNPFTNLMKLNTVNSIIINIRMNLLSSSSFLSMENKKILSKTWNAISSLGGVNHSNILIGFCFSASSKCKRFQFKEIKRKYFTFFTDVFRVFFFF